MVMSSKMEGQVYFHW